MSRSVSTSMTNAEGIAPTRSDIERQLERMLAHPMFKAQKKRAEIFEFIVKNALAGNEIAEDDLWKTKFFTDKRYTEDTTVVRTTVSHIRTELLAEYYKGDGEDDPVLIMLPAPQRSGGSRKNYRIVKRPPGKAYAPEFAYNPRHKFAQELAVAHHLLKGGTAQIHEGLERLKHIRREQPEHPDIVLSVAEAAAGQMLLGTFGELDASLFLEPLSVLEWIAVKHPDYWRTHMVRALLHHAIGNLEEAKAEYNTALSLDRESTISRGWYVLFLFKTGETKEALSLLSAEVDASADNAPLHAMYGVYLNHVRRYKDAERMFTHSLTLDRNCWLAHYGLAEMYLATGKQKQAQEHLERLQALVEPKEYEDLKGRLALKRPRAKTSQRRML